MTVYNAIIVGFWLIFIIVWFVSSWSAKRNVHRSYGLQGFLARLVIVLIIVLLFRNQSASFLEGYAWSGAIHPLASLIGVVLCGIGIAYAIYARAYLGRNWGMPMSVKKDAELVTTGPYAQVRHPIYTGVLLGILGSALVTNLWWIVIFVAAAGYFIYSARREEKLMQETFPDQYPAYKKRTNMLIPFVF